mmetsp:Transcript_29502/g.57054  ORF Transcript_29502/g.57054 Transcript_29502/m.57054 type:complete len:518 (-) Transcript_29502:151-1704(-)
MMQARPRSALASILSLTLAAAAALCICGVCIAQSSIPPRLQLQRTTTRAANAPPRLALRQQQQQQQQHTVPLTPLSHIMMSSSFSSTVPPPHAPPRHGRRRLGLVGRAGEEEPEPPAPESNEALIAKMMDTRSDEELTALIDSSVMKIDTTFWLKINSLAKTAGNAHETAKLDDLSAKVWNRLQELNKDTNDNDGSGLEEYYQVLGAPDEEIQELTADEIMEKRTRKWINEQLSEMWRNYRTFETHHVGEWHGKWEIYEDLLLGGERAIAPENVADVESTIEGYSEAVEDGITVCRHKQTVIERNGKAPYPKGLLDRGLDFWPNSPKTWLVANVFSTGDRVQEEDEGDLLAMEMAVRCNDYRMRVLAKYQKLKEEEERETFTLASIAVGREKLGEMPIGDEEALFASNPLLDDHYARLLQSPSSANVSLATRGNLLVQAPRTINTNDEHFLTISWKTPPSDALFDELKEVYGEAYSMEAARKGLIVTTKRVFTKMNGAAEYISLKEELPEDWKQEYD